MHGTVKHCTELMALPDALSNPYQIETTIKGDYMDSSRASVGYFIFAFILIGLIYSFIRFRDATKRFFKKPIGRFSIVVFFSYFVLTFLLDGLSAFFAPIAHLGRDDTIAVVLVSV